MRMHSASGRSRWPWLITAVIVLLAIIAGIVAFTVGRNSAPTADPTTSVPTTTNAPTTDPTPSGEDESDDAVPTGCLGGPGRDAAMVLSAQDAAPHTMFGAVEVATAFLRAVLQYPYPSDAEAELINASLVASGAHDSMDISAAVYERAGDITNGNVPPGTPFYVSTIGGLWLVSPDSTSDRMTVSVNATYVIDGALSPTATVAGTYTVVWEDDAWRIAGAGRPDVAAIAAGGTQFTGGC